MSKGQSHPFLISFIVFIVLLVIVFGFAYKYPTSFSKYIGYKTVDVDCQPGDDCVEYHYVRLLFELIVLFALSSFIVHVIRKYFLAES